MENRVQGDARSFRLKKAPIESEFRGGFKSLIKWAGKKNLLKEWQRYFDTLPRIRADYAHPLFQSVLTLGMAHGMMVNAIELVNELFAGS